jgi:hypothetical protein
MSQNLNTVPTFDCTNYGYWKARMRFFLKSLDCNIVETGLTKLSYATPELVTEKKTRLFNDKAVHDLCQTLSPFEFARISNSESSQEA